MKSAHIFWSAIVVAVLVASPAFARGGHSGGGGHSRGGGGGGHRGGGGHVYHGAMFHGGHHYRPYFVGGVFFGYSCWDCGYPAYWYPGYYPDYSYPFDLEAPPSSVAEVSAEAARDREADDDSLPADRQNIGMLSLAVRPRDAAIYIDGKLNARAASEDVGLPAGAHHIEVVRPGYQPFERDVTIQPSKTAEIDIHLDTK
jgi:PEGA domain